MGEPWTVQLEGSAALANTLVRPIEACAMSFGGGGAPQGPSIPLARCRTEGSVQATPSVASPHSI